MISTRSRRCLSVAVVVVSLAGTTVSGCTSGKKTPPEQAAAQAFLDAFGTGDAHNAAQRTTEVDPGEKVLAASFTGLGTGATGALKVTGLAERKDASAVANYSASWKLPGVATPWTYTGSLPMIKQGKTWLATWSTTDLHPQLPAGTHFTVKRTLPDRAALLDSAGTALFTPTPVVVIGIHPSKVTNLTVLAATLAAVLKISAADIVADVKAATAEQFVPVITLRRTSYDQVRAKVHDLPGTEFQEDTESLTPSATFAQPLLGRTGPATKEIVDASSGRVQAGDVTGLSGAQRALDAQLTGTAGVQIVAATDADNVAGAVLGSVVAPKPGTPVQLTLNTKTETAADAALAGLPAGRQAAIVAVQPSTGKILAVANSAAATDDIALVGQFPAGSTFKIVTYTAAFTTTPGLNPTSTAQCPPTVTVAGQSFENENKFSYPPIPLSAAFAYSCNTTAVNLGVKLPAGALVQAAGALGLAAKWDLPVDAFSGSLPEPASQNELAAASIGQGKVLVSPLLMASIVGASASGTPVAPSLVVGKQAKPGAALNPTLTTAMNTLLRATVSQPGGTGAALADLPGEIRGKTGTAEFGNDKPPKSHSWFVGTRGDLAFAVFIFGGESSHTGAVPLARAFLTALP